MKNKGGRPQKIDDNNAIEILKRHENGESLLSLAKAFNVSKTTITRAINRGKALRKQEKRPLNWLKNILKK